MSLRPAGDDNVHGVCGHVQPWGCWMDQASKMLATHLLLGLWLLGRQLRCVAMLRLDKPLRRALAWPNQHDEALRLVGTLAERSLRRHLSSCLVLAALQARLC